MSLRPGKRRGKQSKVCFALRRVSGGNIVVPEVLCDKHFNLCHFLSLEIHLPSLETNTYLLKGIFCKPEQDFVC